MKTESSIEVSGQAWIKAHADTVAVLTSVLGSLLAAVVWTNVQFNGVHAEAAKFNAEIRDELSQVKTDVAIIKTIMIMKGIMPCELAEKGE